jgi:hypothetical protein
MSFAGSSSHFERFPIVDGNDYPYWQQRIKIKLRSISCEMWEIIENGFIVAHPESPTQQDEINIRLNTQATDIICDSLCKNIFSRVYDMSTAHEIWNELKNIHDGFVLKSDSHIQMLHAMYARFRSLRGESAMELTDRLSSIVERLRQ